MNTPLRRSLAVLFFSGVFALAGCNGNARKADPASPNLQAKLAGQLPYNPLAWRPITTSSNRTAATMTTLYGNDTAVNYARSTAGASYPAGAVLALVTWSKRDDPHWFGGEIPGTPQSVEFVVVGDQLQYSAYRGSPLANTQTADDQAATRIDYITHQRAAVMP